MYKKQSIFYCLLLVDCPCYCLSYLFLNLHGVLNKLYFEVFLLEVVLRLLDLQDVSLGFNVFVLLLYI